MNEDTIERVTITRVDITPEHESTEDSRYGLPTSVYVSSDSLSIYQSNDVLATARPWAGNDHIFLNRSQAYELRDVLNQFLEDN